MIIISTEQHKPFYLLPGDTFNLTITNRDTKKQEIIISEVINRPMNIDYYCAFQFALDDGSVVGNNIAGFFGMEADLPQEIRDAVRANDMSYEQKVNYMRTTHLTYEWAA